MHHESSEILSELETWYRRAGGRYLLDITRRALQPVLETAFGYHILQLGVHGGEPLCHHSPIRHQVICGAAPGEGVGLVAHSHELPLDSDSVDAVIAHHCLEFSDNPHQVLREIQRVLTPQGQLLVIGFNRYSLHGAASTVRGLLRDPLWQAYRPLSEHRLTDWLHLLGCDVQEVFRLYGVPPAGSGRLRTALERCDAFSARYNLPFSGLYILHAVKQVAGLPRPRRLHKRKSELLLDLVPKPAAAPTPRGQSRNTSEKFEKGNTAA